MLLDACFPNKNEEKLLEVAKKLGVCELLFIYPSRKQAYEANAKIKKDSVLFGFFSQKKGVFEEICVIGSEKRFCYLSDLKVPITQVHIKELKVLSSPLILQVGKLKEQPPSWEVNKILLILRLCKKYAVAVVGASCTSEPNLIISCRESSAILRTIAKNRKPA